MFSKVIKRFIFCLLFFSGVTTIYLYARDDTSGEQTITRLKDKSVEAVAFCKKNGYNMDFCILIDMKVHSGKHRLFVWDLKEEKILHQSLCAHGCGKDDKKSTGAKPLFSNVNGSYLSSLGKYKLGARSYSQWGINVHYKMHGLETTNNNAFKRIIVLHSHNPVPEKEIFPAHLPMGWSLGCPVVDNATMKFLDEKLKKTKKPVLLWIYY